MIKLLAFDVGTRRTGVAFFDPSVGMAFSLETIHHQTMDELAEAIVALAQKRGVTTCIIGLPLLLSGAEGSQSEMVREFAEILQEQGLKVRLRDERFTTKKDAEFDGDAAAACALLDTEISVNEAIDKAQK